MVYKWSVGVFDKVDPNVAGAEFSRIEHKYGEVTCEKLVDESRKKDAVLHDLFEWDDKVAGELYRKNQATKIICSLIKVPADEELKGSKTRAYVNVQTSEDITSKGRFVSIDSAMSDEEMRGIVLKNALRELISFKIKYKTLNELAKIFEAIDYVQEKLNFSENDKGVV